MKLNRSANMLINWTEYDYLQNDRWRISKITQKKLFFKANPNDIESAFVELEVKLRSFKKGKVFDIDELIRKIHEGGD